MRFFIVTHNARGVASSSGSHCDWFVLPVYHAPRPLLFTDHEIREYVNSENKCRFTADAVVMSVLVWKMNKERKKEMDTNEYIQKSFNDSVGAILTYLDESEVGFTTKKAVKSELWELCDKKIMPLAKGLGNDSETNGNR